MTETVRSSSRDALLDAAALVLAEDPSASLGDIAAKAGVGRATLHRHFSSRDDLLRALTLEALQRIDAATATIDETAESATEALWLVIEAVVPLGDRYHVLSQMPGVVDDPAIRATYERQLNDMTALIEAAKTEGAIAADVPTAWAVTVFDALIYAAWAAVHEGAIARRDAPGLAMRSFMEGLGPRGPTAR